MDLLGIAEVTEFRANSAPGVFPIGGKLSLVRELATVNYYSQTLL